MSDDYWSRVERDRDLWRAHDAQYDREVAFRDRAEADERGRRALRQGNTAEALRSAAGPDAALYYLEAMSDLDDDTSDDDLGDDDLGDVDAEEEEEWPPHYYPLTAESLAENMNELPYYVDLKVRVGEDEVSIEAVDRYEEGSVVGSCTAEWSVVLEYLARSGELARTEDTKAIVELLRQALTS